MRDIGFDLQENDILFDKDIVTTELVGGQNAGLIFLKSVASIDDASIGVGFEEIAINATQYEANKLVVSAENQIEDDGATNVSIEATQGPEPGMFEYEISCNYPN